MPVPHPSNKGDLRPTPELSTTRQPSEGELATFQTGVTKFPNLAHRGGFRTWPLEGLFPGVILESHDFNCIAWSVGHTDRFIAPGTVEQMNNLYTQYHYEQCQPADAEVELYRILDAPPMLRNRRGNEYPNSQALVRHAHRRDRSHLDDPPHFGCSSKLADGPLIAHNRRALQDNRTFGSGHPPIQYGTIYQHWRRTPEHPSFPGKEQNLVPATGHYPDHKMFKFGQGNNPPGHPGNDKGVPNPNNGNNQPPQSGSGILGNNSMKSGWAITSSLSRPTTTSSPSASYWPFTSSSRTASLSQGRSATSAQGRPATGTSSTLASRPAAASLERMPQTAASSYGARLMSHQASSSALSSSPLKYAQVPQMRAHDPIPLSSRAAQISTARAYQNILKSAPKLVQAFEARFYAWQKSWYSCTRGYGSDVRARCYVNEFRELLYMGPRILPLVVYKLLGRGNFTGVFLYNALEQDKRYLIDPRDVLNFLVLQRQNNLIIDLNQGRRW